MGRIGLAFRTFFGVLFHQDTAERVALAFRNTELPKIIAPGETPSVAEPPGTKQESTARKEKSPSKPVRSDAITLLEALQREARFVDLCHESLDNFSDEQIGAAARNVIRDSAQVLERFFKLQPVSQIAEGDTLEIPAGFDPGQYRLTGNVSGKPPFRGQIVHAGWRATRCELPQWTGGHESSLVVAPAEVDVK
jgi:hypothetical protein